MGGEQPFGAADAGAEDADAGDLTEAMLQLFKNEREQLEKDGLAHLRRRAAGAAAGAAASRSAAGADRQQAEEQERKSFLLTPHPGLVAVVAEGVRAVAAGAGELVSDYSDLTGAQKSQIGTDWLKHISISSVRKDIEDMHERDSASFLGMLGHTAFRALPSSRQRSVGSVGDEVTSPLQRRPAAATLTSAAPQPQAGLPSTEAAAATAAAPAALAAAAAPAPAAAPAATPAPAAVSAAAATKASPPASSVWKCLHLADKAGLTVCLPSIAKRAVEVDREGCSSQESLRGLSQKALLQMVAALGAVPRPGSGRPGIAYCQSSRHFTLQCSKCLNRF